MLYKDPSFMNIHSKKRKHRSSQLILLLVFIFQAPLIAAEIKGYPWSMGFSGGSAESDGERIGVSLQQGVEWGLGKATQWSVSPFVGLVYDRSNIPEHSWNNVTKQRYGVELSNNFTYGPINWGEMRVGIQEQKYRYRDGETQNRETDRKEAYVRVYMTGNWSR